MSSTAEENEIEALLKRLARAHAEHGAYAIIDAYAPDVLIYDLAPPLGRGGMNRDSIAALFAGWEEPILIDASDLKSTIEGNLAFTGKRGCQSGEVQDTWYCLRMCFRRTKGRWRINYDHASVPFYMDGTHQAAINLKPRERE